MTTIDYLIMGGENISYLSESSILSHVNEYEIFYNLKEIKEFIIKIIDDLKLLTSINTEDIKYHICELWIKNRSTKDISDHRPVLTSIRLT